MRPQHMQPQRRNRALIVVLSILAVILAAAGVLSWMVLNDPNAGKGLENTQPSDALALTAIRSAATGKEASFSPAEINAYLAYLLARKNTAGSNLKIRGAAVTSISGNTADVYLPVTYRGKQFGIVLNLTPSADSADNRLNFQVNSVRVGRLSLPPGWALSRVGTRLPAGFSVRGTALSYALPKMEASVANVTARLRVSSLRLSGGAMELGTKTDVSISG